MKRWLLLLTILILFAGSWAMFATIPLHVISQPTSTGVLQPVMGNLSSRAWRRPPGYRSR